MLNKFKCVYCQKEIDESKVYVVVIKDGEELLYHIECFHKNYTPLEEKVMS